MKSCVAKVLEQRDLLKLQCMLRKRFILDLPAPLRHLVCVAVLQRQPASNLGVEPGIALVLYIGCMT